MALAKYVARVVIVGGNRGKVIVFRGGRSGVVAGGGGRVKAWE